MRKLRRVRRVFIGKNWLNQVGEMRGVGLGKADRGGCDRWKR
jgi:hypothetical protein